MVCGTLSRAFSKERLTFTTSDAPANVYGEA
jgi:hypothetical protein